MFLNIGSRFFITHRSLSAWADATVGKQPKPRNLVHARLLPRLIVKITFALTRFGVNGQKTGLTPINDREMAPHRFDILSPNPSPKIISQVMVLVNPEKLVTLGTERSGPQLGTRETY